MKLASQPRFRCFGFTFLETIVILGLIAVFVGIALARYGGLQHAEIRRVRDQRNAQEITSLAMGATAAGADVIVPGDMQKSIANLMQGRPGTVGTFKGHLFRLPPLTQGEMTGAMQHLVWDAGMISYTQH